MEKRGEGNRREVGRDTSLRTSIFGSMVLTLRTSLMYHILENKLMESERIREHPYLNTNTISERTVFQINVMDRH